jgi:hypothetical protein
MDKLKENLPIISIGLLLLGFTRLITFYHFFHIDITAFIDLTEVLQLQFKFFTTRFLLILLSLSITVFITRKFSKSPTGQTIPNLTSTPIQKQHKTPNLIGRHINAVRFALLALLSLSFFAYEWHKGINTPIWPNLTIISFTISILYILQKQIIFVLQIFESTYGITSLHVNAFLYLSMFMSSAAMLSIQSAFQIMTNKPEFETTIIFSDHTITTNKDLIYVGKTKSFVFLYDKDKDQADVIPTGDIKQIQFRPGLSNVKVPKPYRTKYYHGPK